MKFNREELRGKVGQPHGGGIYLAQDVSPGLTRHLTESHRDDTKKGEGPAICPAPIAAGVASSRRNVRRMLRKGAASIRRSTTPPCHPELSGIIRSPNDSAKSKDLLLAPSQASQGVLTVRLFAWSTRKSRFLDSTRSLAWRTIPLRSE
jgi:hypothetical protein